MSQPFPDKRRLDLPKALPLPDDLVVRRTTMEDVEAVVALCNRCDEPLARPQWHSIDELRLIWNHPDFDLRRDALAICDRSGRLIAYEQVWSKPPYVRHRLFGRVDPDCEGRGIGTALLGWAERIAHSRIDAAPGDALLRLQAWSLAGDAPTRQLLTDHQMALSRHSLTMTMDLVNAPSAGPAWPAGIELRPYGAEQLRQLYTAHREAFRDHYGIAETDVETGYAGFRRMVELDEGHEPKLWYLAWAGEEIAGFALCRRKAFEGPEMAWVDDLAVRRPWRRQGLATALLVHAFAELRSLGRPRIGLWVDAQSLTGATRLYEKVGMKVALRVETYERQIRPGRDYETTNLTL